MKLKTLKDIDLGIYDDACICGHYIKQHDWNTEIGEKEPCNECDCKNFIRPHDNLKQEAIKWIKEIREEFDNERSGTKLEANHYLFGYFEGKIDFIKEFFNLTDEEIK